MNTNSYANALRLKLDIGIIAIVALATIFLAKSGIWTHWETAEMLIAILIFTIIDLLIKNNLPKHPGVIRGALTQKEKTNLYLGAYILIPIVFTGIIAMFSYFISLD
jgi:hypothetical protein